MTIIFWKLTLLFQAICNGALCSLWVFGLIPWVFIMMLALSFQAMFSLNCLGGEGLKVTMECAILCIILGIAMNRGLMDTYFLNGSMIDTGHRLLQEEVEAEESNFPWMEVVLTTGSVFIGGMFVSGWCWNKRQQQLQQTSDSDEAFDQFSQLHANGSFIGNQQEEDQEEEQEGNQQDKEKEKEQEEDHQVEEQENEQEEDLQVEEQEKEHEEDRQVEEQGKEQAGDHHEEDERDLNLGEVEEQEHIPVDLDDLGVVEMGFTDAQRILSSLSLSEDESDAGAELAEMCQDLRDMQMGRAPESMRIPGQVGQEEE
mmetsp:Transcript_96257/g.170959  ORF Transcript_96257/g.170959 Transcript_96257/m.170959 type:complete len:314 (+) Transcript_96257:174-1115(+)